MLSEEACPPVSEDLEVVERLRGGGALVRYVGTVEVDGAYKDVYLAVGPGREVHVVEVRRMCIGERG